MKLFAVIHEDRHDDVQVYLFYDETRAMVLAQSIVVDCGDEDYDPVGDEAAMSEEDLTAAGWLYYRPYNPEGDYVRVQSIEVDSQ